MNDLDQFDYQILDILQTNNMINLKEIGDKIGLSAPAVQRRIKQLRKSGAILKDVAVLNPDFIGSPITLIVQVEMETDKVEVITGMKKKFNSLPQIQHCYYVTGEVDFVLIMVVETMKEYEILTHELFFNNANVLRFKTLVNMDIVKQSSCLPILPLKKVKI